MEFVLNMKNLKLRHKVCHLFSKRRAYKNVNFQFDIDIKPFFLEFILYGMRPEMPSARDQWPKCIKKGLIKFIVQIICQYKCAVVVILYFEILTKFWPNLCKATNSGHRSLWWFAFNLLNYSFCVRFNIHCSTLL